MSILGIDEVGLGALAGPAFVGLVAFGESVPSGLRDSKKLSRIARERIFPIIKDYAIICEIEPVPIDEIELYNIRGAINLAIARAFNRVKIEVKDIYMDGVLDPNLGRPVICVKGGDDIIPAISAASIVAKVTRDAFMFDLAKTYPCYDWDNNVGYPTKKHLNALKSYGVSPWHRLKYRPVKAFL